LVSGATETVRRYAETHRQTLGVLAVPKARNAPKSLEEIGLPIAADNGCFGGLDSQSFVEMLNSFREEKVALDWVAVPDVVCDADKTFVLWGQWERIVRAFGFVPAMVIQDGATRADVDMFSPPAVFIGGSTDYKLGEEARKITKMVRSQGKPVHMGRVNTFARIKYAVDIGCTSCDGSGFSKWPDTRIPLGLRWIDRAMKKKQTQPTLF
jgi:hypothetical protein